jgi:hypothetical protein
MFSTNNDLDVIQIRLTLVYLFLRNFSITWIFDSFMISSFFSSLAVSDR